jgi:hypothetical protein
MRFEWMEILHSAIYPIEKKSYAFLRIQSYKSNGAHKKILRIKIPQNSYWIPLNQTSL